MRFSNAIAELKAAIRSKPTNSTAYGLTQLVVNDEYYGKPPANNAIDLAKLYGDSPFARSVVNLISQRVARQRWYFEDADGERVDKHPALDFIRAGCPQLRGRQAIKAHQTLMELQGECFWIIGRNLAGNPMGFAPIPSHWVLDTPGKLVKGYRVQPRSGVAFEADPEDVIHFRDPNPVDPYGRGISIANAARVELECEHAASEFVAKFFSNNAIPAYVVSGVTGEPLGEKNAVRLEETLREKFGGFRKGWRPLISQSELKITPISVGLKDNELVATRELSKQNITEIWGVPPELLGRLENANTSTIDNAEAIFAKNVIDPRLAFIEDHLQPFVESNFDVRGLELRYENPIAEDDAFKLDVMKASPGDFSRNEKRRLAKMKPTKNPADDELFEQIDPAEVLAAAAANNNEGGPDKEPPKGGKKPKKDPAKTFEGVRTKALTFEDVVRVSGAHEDPQVTAEATKIFDEIFAALIAKFGRDMLGSLEAEADFLITGEVAEWIATESPDLLGKIDATTRKELLAALTEGAAVTEDVDALIKRVEAIFAEAGKFRASTIGDTIATKLAGFTTKAAARQAGIDRKKWLSSRDQAVRGTHRKPLDGQVKRLDEKFQSASGAQADHPGAFGKAAEDVNCRCAMRPVIQGEKSATASDEEFAIEYEKLRSRAAAKIATAARKVFTGQEAVIISELRRVGEFRR